MKTKPGQAALFDHVKSWITTHIDAPAGLRISGNLVRAYFRPGELGNREKLTTYEAFRTWAEKQQIELNYIESSDIYHLKQRQLLPSGEPESETTPAFRRPGDLV